MEKGSLTKQSCSHMRDMLEDPKIHERVTSPVKGGERYQYFKIIRETGVIQIGKYNWDSFFGSFWNNLIKCEQSISFDEFALRVWDALTEMTAHDPRAHACIVEGLGREVLIRGIREKRWDWLIDRFYDICLHVIKDGYWTSKALDNINAGGDNNGSVVVTIADHAPRGVLKVVDSIGDAFEVLNVRWLGGR